MVEVTQTHNHFMALSLGLPRWASTRRNIYPLTSILIIKHPLSTPPSTMIHRILLVQFMCLTVLFHNLSPGPGHLWSTSWSETLYFILNTFLHLIVAKVNMKQMYVASYALLTKKHS